MAKAPMPNIKKWKPPLQCIILKSAPRIISVLARGRKVFKANKAHFGIVKALIINACLTKRDNINQINKHKLGMSLNIKPNKIFSWISTQD